MNPDPNEKPKITYREQMADLRKKGKIAGVKTCLRHYNAEQYALIEALTSELGWKVKSLRAALADLERIKAIRLVKGPDYEAFIGMALKLGPVGTVKTRRQSKSEDNSPYLEGLQG